MTHISAGFSTIGNSMWLAATQASGNMATKSVILQSQGTKLAFAKKSMARIDSNDKIKVNLKFLRIFGTSVKKFESLSSFAVDPHCLDEG